MFAHNGGDRPSILIVVHDRELAFDLNKRRRDILVRTHPTRKQVTHNFDKLLPIRGFRQDTVDIQSVPVVFAKIRDLFLWVAISQQVNELSCR